jgi:hypothetical protein
MFQLNQHHQLWYKEPAAETPGRRAEGRLPLIAIVCLGIALQSLDPGAVRGSPPQNKIAPPRKGQPRKVSVEAEKRCPGPSVNLNPDEGGKNDALKEEFFYQLNQYRAAKGRGLLRRSPSLSISAELFSRQLAESGAVVFHADGRGAEAPPRLDADDSQRGRGGIDYTVVTDTLFYRTRFDPATLLEIMKARRSDDAILLDPEWGWVGIGRNYSRRDEGWYWVLDFAVSCGDEAMDPVVRAAHRIG